MHPTPALLERLEDRLLLSNVTAVIQNGDLVITGTDAVEDIIISGGGQVPYSVHSGLGVPTTVNGGAGPVTFPFTFRGDIIVRLGGGDDVLSVNVLNAHRDLRIDMGAGAADEAFVQAGVIARNLVIDAGEGATGAVNTINNQQILGKVMIAQTPGGTTSFTDTRVLGNVTISGSGGGNVDILDTTLARSLNVTNHSGDATVDLISSHVGRSVKIRQLAAGTQTTTLDGTTVCGSVAADCRGGTGVFAMSGSACAIEGNLKLLNGSGNDTATILSSVIGGGVNIVNGNGANTTTFTGVTVARKLNITGGSGVDSVTLTYITASGGMTIITGDDADVVKLDDIDAARPVRLDAGAGNDQVLIEQDAAIDGPLCVFHSSLSVLLGEGVDQLRMGTAGESGRHAVLEGLLKVNGGVAGQDTFNSDHVTFLGKTVYTRLW